MYLKTDPPMTDFQDDIALLIHKFDTNGDRKISLEEFVNFSLNIPHLTWRAEKARRGSRASTDIVSYADPTRSRIRSLLQLL
jgi:hypothetical protein